MNQSRSELPAPLPASVLGDSAARYDVIVIGFGIAGASAALEAARAGARVLLLERAAVHGGTTCMAGGHFYLGGGTAVQQATGHRDSAEEMYKYLVAVSKEPEHDKIRAYCEGSVEHFGWLESLGFEFERSYFPGKAVIQPGTEGLMFTGNEKVWPFGDQAAPAPRGHKVPVPGDTGGAKLVMNAGMVARYTPALSAKLIALGTTYDDGLGIRLGISAGADVRHMDEPFITAPIYPPSVLITGLIVNSRGERFVAEDSYHARGEPSRGVSFHEGRKVPMPSTDNNVSPEIVNGLAEYAVALNDRQAAQFGGMVYKRVARELEALVQGDDKCKLAFPSFLVRPDLRAECFVVILQDRLVIAWKAGVFRKSSGSMVIPFASITSIRREKGTASGTRGAALLVISGSQNATIALPVDKTDAAVAVIRTAIGPTIG